MPIHRAAVAELPRLQRFVTQAGFRSDKIGFEELETLVHGRTAWTGNDGIDPWGLIAFDPIRDSNNLLRRDSSERGSVDLENGHTALRILALDRGRSPVSDGARLIEAACSEMLRNEGSVEVICLCRERWLRSALESAGFELAERIQFLRLSNLQKRTVQQPRWEGTFRIEDGGPQHVDRLVHLDAAAFPPRWQYDPPALMATALASKLRIVWFENRPVAYAAISVDRDEALLDRIAVEPAQQGLGIGNRLLADALLLAQARGSESVLLNTQNHNESALNLYGSAGFRPTGYIVPVYTFSTRNRASRGTSPR